MLGYRKINGYLIHYSSHALVLSKLILVSMNDGSFTDRELKKMKRITDAIGDSNHFDVEIRGSSNCKGFWVHLTFECKSAERTISLEREIDFLEKLSKA